MKLDIKNKIANNSNKKDLGVSFLLLTFVCVLVFSCVFVTLLDNIPNHLSEAYAPDEPVGIIFVFATAVCYIYAMKYYFAYAIKKHYTLAYLSMLIAISILIVDMFFSIGGPAPWGIILLIPIFPIAFIVLLIVGVKKDICSKEDSYVEIDDEEE